MKQTKSEKNFKDAADSFFENEFFHDIDFNHQQLAVAENSLPLKDVSDFADLPDPKRSSKSRSAK